MLSATKNLARLALVCGSVLAVSGLANAGCVSGKATHVPLKIRLEPPRVLAFGEAYTLVVEVGEFGPDSVLSVFGPDGVLIGSMTPAFGLPLPQSARIGLIRSLPKKGLEVEVRVHPRDDFKGRKPTDTELLKIELVPTGITP